MAQSEPGSSGLSGVHFEGPLQSAMPGAQARPRSPFPQAFLSRPHDRTEQKLDDAAAACLDFSVWTNDRVRAWLVHEAL